MKNTSKSDRRGRARRIRSFYEDRLAKKSLPDFEILSWSSPHSQEARFKVLVDNVDLRGKSLLDVGCGLGNLLGYLNSQRIATDYTGVDISERMTQAALQRHPDGRFVYADIFLESPFQPRAFDVVFCSGAFNLNLGNNDEFIGVAIRHFQELSRQCVVFNLLHDRAQGSDNRFAYYSPGHVLKLMAPAGWSIRVIDDYLPNDFTIIAQRQDERL